MIQDPREQRIKALILADKETTEKFLTDFEPFLVFTSPPELQNRKIDTWLSSEKPERYSALCNWGTKHGMEGKKKKACQELDQQQEKIKETC